jgi:hypothetical protein
MVLFLLCLSLSSFCAPYISPRGRLANILEFYMGSQFTKLLGINPKLLYLLGAVDFQKFLEGSETLGMTSEGRSYHNFICVKASNLNRILYRLICMLALA